MDNYQHPQPLLFRTVLEIFAMGKGRGRGGAGSARA